MLSILKASAGSGKTYQLTRDYIIMLLGEKNDGGEYRLYRRGMRNRHRHILAITFTNKATEEMKARIVNELAVLAGMEPNKPEGSDYEAELIRLFGCSAEQLRSCAREALEMLLFDYNCFNVSTIDSFFQLILRTFAYEAELEGDYDVTIDEKQVVRSALDSILSEISSSRGEATKGQWLETIMKEKAEEGEGFNYFNRDLNDFKNVVKFVENLLTEKFMEHSEEMENYYASERLEQFIATVNALAARKIALGRRLGRKALEVMEHTVFASPKQGVSKNLVGALEKLSRGELPAVTTTITKPLNENGKGIITGYKGNVAEEYGEVYAAVTDACGFVCDNTGRLNLLDILKKGFTVLRMMKQVVMRMEQLRVENNSLLLNDANTLLRRIIGEDDAPFVYERVGMKLHHLLIDEFQDTSGSQWDILRPLINDSLGWGHDNLIIGDEKQSIYRFRGSDSSLIRKRVMKDVAFPPEVRGDNVDENTNWRSAPEIVEFNNMMFTRLADFLGFGDIYGNVEQRVSRKKSGTHGYVSAQIASDADEYEVLWRQRMVLNMKRQLLESGYKGSDICVLTRGNSEAADVISFLNEVFDTDKDLKSRNLMVISDDSLRIERSPAVRRLLSGMRNIATQRNALAAVAGEPADRRQRPAGQLVNLLSRYEDEIGRGADASSALKNAVTQADKTSASDFLDSIRNKVVGLSLPVLTELMVAHFFPEGSLPREEMIYVLAFEDVVLDFCNTDGADLQGFLRWWDSGGFKSTLSSAKNENAVRVMTIHKSKGLEFKCVYLCQGKGSAFKRNDTREWFDMVPVEGIDPQLLPPIYPVLFSEKLLSLPFEKQYREKINEILLDALNVEYVAFTRAVDELIVTVLQERPIDVSKPVDVVKLVGKKAADLAAAGLNMMGVVAGVEYQFGNPYHERDMEGMKHKLTDTSGSVEFPAFTVSGRHDMWDNVKVDGGADESVKRVEGTNLHKVMSMIKHPGDLSKAVTRGVRMGIIEREKRVEIEEFIRKAIDSVESRGWFDGYVRLMNERHIILDESSRREPEHKWKTPDRVVVMPDGHVEVIDYKFGEKRSKSHSLQVKGYVNCLRRAGYDDVRGFVWYVSRGEVSEV